MRGHSKPRVGRTVVGGSSKPSPALKCALPAWWDWDWGLQGLALVRLWWTSWPGAVARLGAGSLGSRGQWNARARPPASATPRPAA